MQTTIHPAIKAAREAVLRILHQPGARPDRRHAQVTIHRCPTAAELLRAAYLTADPAAKRRLFRSAADAERRDRCPLWAAIILPLVAGIDIGIVIAYAIMGRSL